MHIGLPMNTVIPMANIVMEYEMELIVSRLIKKIEKRPTEPLKQ